jgi:hypothetical protein
MNNQDKKVEQEPMVEQRDEERPLSELPHGTSDPEMANWPLKVKQGAMPPIGSIVTAGPIKTPKGWAMMAFRVTYRNAAKLRISAELINKLIPVPDPPAKPEDPGGRTTLDVQPGAHGASSKF